MKSEPLHGINGVRALASLLIVSFHISEFLKANSREIWFPFQQTPGVHLFLVMSGFILVYTMREDDAPGRFIVRRLARIVPLYWLLTVCVIGLAMWRSWLFPGIDLSPQGIAYSLFFLPDANLAGAIQPNLFTGWTLNYIVLAYGAFALAMIAPMRQRPYAVVSLLIGFMLMANFLPDPVMRRFWTDPMLLEVIGGMAVGLLVRQPRVIAWVRERSMWPLILASLAALVLALMSPLSGFGRVLACGFAASATIFAVAARDLHQPTRPAGLLSRLGTVSYSIYLLHPIVVPLMGVLVVGRLGAPWLEIVVMFAGCYGLTIAAANVTYALIERPARDWVSRRAGGRLRIAPERQGRT